MTSRKLLILTALPMEAKALSIPSILQYGQIQIIGLRASRLAPTGDFAAVMLAGLSAGLDPALGRGDIVIDSTSTLIPGEQLFSRAKIHTSPGLLSTPAQKGAVFRQTGCRAADMESAFVREYARRQKLRFINIRSISDTAMESIPANILSFLDSGGRPRPLKIASELVLHPGLIPRLVQLRTSAAEALGSLASAVEKIIQTWI